MSYTITVSTTAPNFSKVILFLAEKRPYITCDFIGQREDLLSPEPWEELQCPIVAAFNCDVGNPAVLLLQMDKRRIDSEPARIPSLPPPDVIG